MSPEVWAGVASGGSFLGPPFLLRVEADGPSQAGPHVETWRRGEQGTPAESGLQWGPWRSRMVGGAGGSWGLSTRPESSPHT